MRLCTHGHTQPAAAAHNHTHTHNHTHIRAHTIQFQRVRESLTWYIKGQVSAGARHYKLECARKNVYTRGGATIGVTSPSSHM